jgi:hypothetical protein
MEWGPPVATPGVYIFRILREEVFYHVTKSKSCGVVQRDGIGLFWARGYLRPELMMIPPVDIFVYPEPSCEVGLVRVKETHHPILDT